jgi:hypothetical protein
MRKLSFAFLVALLVVPLFALAQQAIPDPSADLGGFLALLLGAVQGKDWFLVGAAVASGLTWPVRFMLVRLPGGAGAFFSTSRGGVVIALAVGMLTGLSGALLAHTPFSLGLVVNIVGVGFTAIGGYAGLRRLLGLV